MNDQDVKQRQKAFKGLAICLFLPLAYVLWILPAFIKPNYEEPTESMIGLGIMWIINALLFGHLHFSERQSLRSIGLRSLSLRQFFIALGLGLLLSILIPTFYTFLSLFGKEAEGQAITEASRQAPLLILFGIITAAVTEEILIRAYPLERLNKLFHSKWPGIFLSIGAFCLIHIQSWNLLHIAGIVLPLGIILTFLYLKTRNLLFVILVHFFIDLPLFIMAINRPA